MRSSCVCLVYNSSVTYIATRKTAMMGYPVVLADAAKEAATLSGAQTQVIMQKRVALHQKTALSLYVRAQTTCESVVYRYCSAAYSLPTSLKRACSSS